MGSCLFFIQGGQRFCLLFRKYNAWSADRDGGMHPLKRMGTRDPHNLLISAQLPTMYESGVENRANHVLYKNPAPGMRDPKNLRSATFSKKVHLKLTLMRPQTEQSVSI